MGKIKTKNIKRIVEEILENEKTREIFFGLKNFSEVKMKVLEVLEEGKSKKNINKISGYLSSRLKKKL